jgi:hypothetical protein
MEFSLDICGSGGIASSFLMSALHACDKFHDLAALSPGKSPPESIGQEAE